MQHRSRWTALLSAIPLIVMFAATASAYTGQVEGSVSVSGTVSCSAPFTVSAKFVDANGTPVVGQSVTWSFVSAPSASDTVSNKSATTNAQGVATANVTLGHVSGTRRVRATAGDVSASAVLSPACGAGLPRTSTLETPTDSDGSAPILAVVFALGLAIVGGFTVRRLGLIRR